MRVKWTIKRIILSLLVMSLWGVGGNFIWKGFQNDRDFETWGKHRLMEGPVDFSEPGEFTFTSVQTSSIPHDALVRLILPAEFEEKDSAELMTLMAPLEATLSMDPKVEKFSPELLEYRRHDDKQVPLFRLPLLGRGTREVTVTVLRGVPALKGVPQRIEGRYRLCGCERLLGVVGKVLGTVLVLLGLPFAIPLVCGILRERKGTVTPYPTLPGKTDESS